jgi:hypothetical protein
MTVNEDLGAALGLTAEPTPPEPPEGHPEYKSGEVLFGQDKAPPPVNAGKCAGDTDPNALQQAPPIEFIHFGYVHLSRTNLFKHPTYPGDQGSTDDGGQDVPQESSEPKGELFQNKLFRKQAKKNKADWIKEIDPDPDGSGGGGKPDEADDDKQEEQEDSPSDEGVESVQEEPEESEESKPAGQAILMRDALLRESLVLRGFTDSTIKLHRDWKKSGTFGAVGAALGGLFGQKPPDALCLKRVKNKVAGVAKTINAETAKYVDVHEAGLKLNRARFQYREYCKKDLKDYFCKPSSMGFLARLLFNTLNKVSSEVGTFFHLTSNVDNNFYAVYIGLCEEYEPVIDYYCDQFSVEAIKAFNDPMYDIWFRPKGKEEKLPGRGYLDQIFDKLAPSEAPKPEAKDSTGDSMEKTKSDTPTKQESTAKESGDAPGAESLPEPAPPPEARQASLVVVKTLEEVVGRDKLPRPFPWWFRVWVNHDIKTLKKLYVKLLEQTDDDREVEIDEEFVRDAFGTNWMAKLLKIADCIFQVLKICYETYEKCSACYQKLTAAGKSESKAKEISGEEKKKLAEYRRTHGMPPEGIVPAGGAAPPKLTSAQGAQPEVVTDAPEKPEDGAGPSDPLQQVKKEQDQQDMTKIDLETLKKLDEDEQKQPEEAEAEEETPKQADKAKEIADKIDAMWEETKKVVEGIGKTTISTVAQTLEEARKEAKEANALTMEVYLSRLPYLLALLISNTSLKVWKETIGKVFMAAVKTGISLASKKDDSEDGAGDVGGKIKEGASAAGELGKSAVSLFVKKKSPFAESGFPPDERVEPCEGAEISKSDRKKAADQVSADPPTTVFLEVEA